MGRSEAVRAQQGKATYQRKLPHIQRGMRPLYITFVTSARWTLPEAAREFVLRSIVHDHGVTHELHAGVAMPDHVHVILSPRRDEHGAVYPLGQITGRIKSASAHAVNRLLAREGKVWQTESFDHVLRTDESTRSKGEYICQNPVRAGLVSSPDDYPWLWREWVEGLPTGDEPRLRAATDGTAEAAVPTLHPANASNLKERTA